MSKTSGLSVIIITFNESRKIEDCLKSVKFADEIIVIDSGSTDSTREICLRYTTHVYQNTPWPGFGAQKNIALSYAKFPWVLSIDADERIMPELKKQILNTIARTDSQSAYLIPRSSSFCGQFMRFSGWAPDYVLRLFRRNEAKFSDDFVHERIILKNKSDKIGKLSSPLIHYAVDNVSQAAKKMHSYAELSAKNKWKNRKKSNLLIASLRGTWSFIRTYILQLGFLDGVKGIVLARFNASGTYRKYALLQQLNRHKGQFSCALVITTYNWPEALEQVLKSVQHQTKIPDEIIIADDGSGTATAELIKKIKAKTGLPIKHVWQKDDGFRAAQIRNKAIAATQCDYIIFIDGDCLLQQDFIAKHCLLARPLHITDGNRIILNKKNTAHVLCGQSFYDFLSLPQHFKLLYIPLGYLRKIAPVKWKGVKTCNVGIYRTDLFQVNGFDESYTGWGFEDSDLVVRLYNSGIKRISARSATSVIHLWHETNFDKTKAKFNHQHLDKTIKNKTTWIENGLNQYHD